jgi:hypothetical protein
MNNLKIISTDELHQTIGSYITDNEVIIGEYDDMKEVILRMIRVGYMFNMDRDRLRDAMEDITFLCCPDDDVNKDRVARGLEYDEDSDDDDDNGNGVFDEKFCREMCDNEECLDGCIKAKEGTETVEDIGDTSDMPKM